MAARLIFHFAPNGSRTADLEGLNEMLTDVLAEGGPRSGADSAAVVTLPDTHQIVLVDFNNDGGITVDHLNRAFDEVGDPVVNNFNILNIEDVIDSCSCDQDDDVPYFNDRHFVTDQYGNTRRINPYG